MGEAAEDPKPNQRKKRKRRWWKRLLIWVPSVLVVLCLLLAALLYFAGDKVFAAVWPTVDKKLSAKGIYLDYGSVEQTRERGIVLRDIVLYADRGRQQPLATLSDVAVKAKFFQKGIGIAAGRVSFDSAELQLWTGDTDPAIRELDGSLLVGGKGVSVDTLYARHMGIELSVDGDLAWADLSGDKKKGGDSGGDKADVPEEGGGGEKPPLDLTAIDFSPVDEMVRWLDVEESGGHLKIDAKLGRGEGEAPGIVLTLAGSEVVWRKVPIRKLEILADLDLTDGRRSLAIAPLNLAYLEGELAAQAKLDLEAADLSVKELRCDIDLVRLATELHPPLAEPLAIISYESPAEWSLAGTVDLRRIEGSDLNGNIVLPRGLSIGSGASTTEISTLSSEIAFVDGVAHARGLRVGFYGGLLVADADARPFQQPLKFAATIATERPLPISGLCDLLRVESDAEGEFTLAASASGDLEALKIELETLGHGEDLLEGVFSLYPKRELIEIESLRSGLDLASIARALQPDLVEPLAMISESAGPAIAARGSLNYKDIPSSDLEVALSEGGSRWVLDLGQEPVAIERFAATVRLRDGEVSTDDLLVAGPVGELGGKVSARPFGEELSMRGELRTTKGLSIAGISRFIGEPSDSPDLLGLEVAWDGGLEQISVPKLQITEGDRVLNAVLDADLKSGVIGVDSLQSDLNLVELARSVVPSLGESMAVVRSAAGPALKGSGAVHYKDIATSELKLELSSEAGVELDLDGRPLKLEGLGGTFAMREGNVSCPDFKVRLLGGEFHADLAAQPFGELPTFQAALLADGLDLAQIVTLAGSEKPSPGSVSFNFQGTGSTLPEHLNGRSEFDVTMEEFHAFPLFSRIYQTISHLNVGVLRDKKEEGFARGAITIVNGVVDTSDIALEAPSLKATVPGKVDLVAGEIDMKALASPSGLVGVATNTVTGKIEVDITGPLAEPEVKLGLDGGLAGGSLDLVGDGLGVAGDVAGGTLKVAGGVVGLNGDKKEGGEGAAAPAETEAEPEEKKRFRRIRGLFGGDD